MNKNHSVNSSQLKPQLLFSIPSSLNMKQSILENTLQSSFPNGIDISYYEEKPKIYSIIFTDRESNNYYYYILLFYEKISSDSISNKCDINRNSDINAVAETFYCPISIIIWSDYDNFVFFRSLLISFYKIIKFDKSYLEKNSNIYNNIINEKNSIIDDNSISSNSNKEKILSYQKIELLNYLNFCYELPRPPNASIFCLNMRFDKISYNFQSLLEIPTDDYCLDVLFNTLEISVIIKLFVALLFEKFIIIISNQNMPLFCICESLRYLLFPFEHSFTYIPNLPFEKKDYLDSPVPYLIGINTSELSGEELINPYRIICDVGTSTLYGDTSKLKLPLEEEIKIKSKLIILRSKYKNTFDNIDIEGIKKKENPKTNDEDNTLDFNLSFAQNVQNIFFSIFKTNLRNIKDYIKNNNFNSQKFLNSFKNEEYKLFFNIIIKTAAFEIFINSMSYLNDSSSRKFNMICKNESNQRSKETEQKNYYKYSFNIPKKLNKFFKVSEFKDIYDEYNQISNLLDENCFLNSKNSFKFNKSHRSTKINNQYCYLNFYGKDNFISFASHYKSSFNYNIIIKNEIIKLYKEILKVYFDEENFFENSHKLMPDLRQTFTTKTNKKINKNLNEEDFEVIIEAPIKSCCQIYILIAILFYNNLKNKAEDHAKKNNMSKISDNQLDMKKNELNIKNEHRRGSTFLSQFKYKNNNRFFLEHIIEFKGDYNIDNIFIFKLFLFSFRKNKKEFPRNLFFTLLGEYSLDELKKIQDTKIKYIDETIQCRIRELEKKAYKTPVIKLDSENEEDEDAKSLPENKKNGKNRNTTLNVIKRENSSINLNIVKSIFNLDDDEEDESMNKSNIKKMKLNVVDSLNSTYDINLTELRNFYIQRKLSQKTNSWNAFNLENIPLLTNNNSDDNIDFQRIDPKLDPMLISEQICIKLYIYLSKVKIENLDEKTDNTDFLIDLAHSNEINEIKDLILTLRNISIEALSKKVINYYCFWLNIYNFLIIFSYIYKCEGFSNSYEWNRFMKNSYFTIGNIEISLLEIETIILREKSISEKIYGYKKYDSQLELPKIQKFDNIINFGISMLSSSSPSIRIYFPTNFMESLKLNATEFFWRSIKIDLDNNELTIPEYITWIEPDFITNLDKYKDYLQEDYWKFIDENKNNLKVKVEKYNWKISFANFKNNETNLW